MHKLFVCPVCKNSLSRTTTYVICRTCHSKYPVVNGIIDFIPYDLLPLDLATSQKEYDSAHKKQWHRISDGSYEILASFARGNRTLDIACGDGFIEALAPQTCGLDFSRNALLKAKKKGAKYLVQATAEYLPFKKNSFDLTLCAGSFEHFADPQKALAEMARVARMHIFTIHKEFPLPYARYLRALLLRLKGIPDQPIDHPFRFNQLQSLITRAGLHIVFNGVWTHPYDIHVLSPSLSRLITPLPSCYFVITVRQKPAHL